MYILSPFFNPIWTYLVATPLKLHKRGCDGWILIILVHKLCLSLDRCELEQHLRKIFLHHLPSSRMVMILMTSTMRMMTDCDANGKYNQRIIVIYDWSNHILIISDHINPLSSLKIIMMVTCTKMTGGTPEVRSDKSLTLMTFGRDQWNNGPMD